MTSFFNASRFYPQAFLRSILAISLVFLAIPAHAQSVIQSRVVTACGTQAYTAGTNAPDTQDTTGNGCNGGGGSSAVLGKVGGYEFNVGTIPTVQNGSYTAGQSLGGLQTVSVASTNSITGILDQIGYASKGGSTFAVVIYVWDTNPSGTTCTDKTNFVVSATDNQHLVGGAPILLTPAVVVSGQDTETYAAATNLTGNFTNGSTNTNLYVCILANATGTPGSTTDIRFNIQGIKDAP